MTLKETTIFHIDSDNIIYPFSFKKKRDLP
uniref:Uncharacterized protein n=1 Tax=Arundo donax TaxID=35708 RepID=A0A0A8XUU3_ARUDO